MDKEMSPHPASSAVFPCTTWEKLPAYSIDTPLFGPTAPINPTRLVIGRWRGRRPRRTRRPCRRRRCFLAGRRHSRGRWQWPRRGRRRPRSRAAVKGTGTFAGCRLRRRPRRRAGGWRGGRRRHARVCNRPLRVSSTRRRSWDFHRQRRPPPRRSRLPGVLLNGRRRPRCRLLPPPRRRNLMRCRRRRRCLCTRCRVCRD